VITLPGAWLAGMAPSHGHRAHGHVVHARGRVRHGVIVPMLSTADIDKLLKHYLSRPDTTDKERLS
jgi:hypothetical protein